jgi:dihydroceramidase
MRWYAPPLLAFAACVALAIIAGTVTLNLEGWRPAFCDGGACFCEAPRAAGWAQPSNTFSNLGYVLAGLLALGWSGNQPLLPAGANLMRRQRAYALVFGIAIVAIGLGSLFFHGTLTFAGQFTDLLGMYLLSNLLLVYNLARLFKLNGAAFAALYVGLTVAFGGLMLIAPETRRYTFAAGIASALILEVALYLRRRPKMEPAWLLTALAVFGVAYVVWTLDGTGAWCDPTGWLQGHAVWHLLGAASAGLAFVYYWREKDR